MVENARDRIRAFAAEAVSGARLPAGAGRLVAVGWATVETDRAIRDLAVALGVTEAAFNQAPGSGALGASCLVLDMPLPGDIALAVIEPATEGRIAAGLARWDEGPLVAWYEAAPGRDGPSGIPGPFGPERLVGGDPLTGPHRLLVVDEPGTIRA